MLLGDKYLGHYSAVSDAIYHSTDDWDVNEWLSLVVQYSDEKREALKKRRFWGHQGIVYLLSEEINTLEIFRASWDLEGAIEIPPIINIEGADYSVVKVGHRAFADCGSLQSVTLPESITSIGINAFLRCVKMDSINIPNHLEEIGVGAFCQTQVRSLIIPKTVTNLGELLTENYRHGIDIGVPQIHVSTENSTYYSIDGCVFTKDGKYLLQWGEGVEELNLTASFDHNASAGFDPQKISLLKHLVIEEGNVNGLVCEDDIVYSPSWFYSRKTTGIVAVVNKANKRKYAIKEGVYEICDEFQDNSVMDEIWLPSTLGWIDDGAFKNCTSLKNVHFHPDTRIKYYGNEAFRNCSSLESITIPYQADGFVGHDTQIGDGLFVDCSSLKTIILNCTGITLYEGSIQGCDNLKEIIIDDYSSTNVDRMVFVRHPNVKTYNSEHEWINAVAHLKHTHPYYDPEQNNF